MNRSFVLPIGSALVFLSVTASLGQTPTVKEGSEIMVSSYNTGDQSFSDIALDSEGGFVIVWNSSNADNGDGNSSSIQGQRFASDGSLLGAQFLVNAYTSDDQFLPAITMAANGDFVVVWEDYNGTTGDSDGRGIQGRRFLSDGTPNGSQFLVNTYTTSYQSSPAIAMDGAGAFVVVWSSSGSDNGDTEYGSIQAQRFASDASPLGSQFLVNTYTTEGQTEPAVAMAENGGFVVVWTSQGSAGSDADFASTQARRFTTGGIPIGDQFQVNTETTGSQVLPDIAMNASGAFAVAWSGGFEQDVAARIFTSNGESVGGEFQVNTFTPGFQLRPDIAIDETGDFVVLWRSSEADNGDDDVSLQGQRFASGGDPIGGQFLVNTFTTGYQQVPAVDMEPRGDFVAAWTQGEAGGFLGGAPPGDIRAQRFRVTADLGDRVFLDADFDGLQGPSDPGLANIVVHLYEEGGDLVDSTHSDAQGDFLFSPKIGLAGVADRFYLEFEPTLRYAFTTPNVGADDAIDSDADIDSGQTHTFEITSAGSDDFDIDAGLTNGIGDRVWHDANGDGVQTGGEEGIDGVNVHLHDALDTLLDSTKTADGGFYSFADLDSGTYYLSFELPDGYRFTTPEQGDEASDSDVGPLTGTTQLFFLATGELRTDVDAGLRLILFADGFESGDTSKWMFVEH